MLIGAFLAAPTAAQSPTYEPNQRTTAKIRVEEAEASTTVIRGEDALPVEGTTDLVRPASRRGYTEEEVQAKIIDYSILYGIDPTLPLAVARCESNFRESARNPSSSASGVFQYLDSTWKNTPEGRDGRSVFDADANIAAAIRHIATKGTSPWNASRSCWLK